MTTADLLESRHTTFLSWHEPWPACDADGKEFSASVEHRATVFDCIGTMRAVFKAKDGRVHVTDEQLLNNFMALHWATVAQP